MGACCTKDNIYGGFITYDLEEGDSNGGGDGEDVRCGDDGAIVRLRGSSAFTSMFSQRGRKGINQDAMTVWEDFMGEKDLIFCGVFDGHGPSGHRVAGHARDVLPSKLSNAIKKQLSQLENGVSEVSAEPDNNGGNLLVSRWEAALVESFKEVDRELAFDSSIDCFCSGTTAVTIIKQGEHLVIANLGDSRAVLCTRGDRNQHLPIQLTVDQKPNVPSEAERIKNCQGRVFAEKEEPDIYRVWMPDDDYPGLAMSRSFGDFCLKDYGLISTPLLSYRKLTGKDEFIVIATDGIWDVLTNKQVISIVASAKNRSTAARLVVKLAVGEWQRQFPGSMVDDCAVICLFFKNPPLLTRSKTSVGRRDVKSRPELSVSRSYRTVGIGKKGGGGGEEAGSAKAESREDWKTVQGLNRANSLSVLPRFAPAVRKQKTEKIFHEVEAL